jgi:hypothetical protein
VSGSTTYRTSPLRVVGFACFCLLGLYPLLAPSSSTVVRLVGAVFVVLGAYVVALGLAMKVTIADGRIEVRTLTGRRVFRNGQSSMQMLSFNTLIGGAKGVQLVGGDGQAKVTFSLVMFAKETARRLLQDLRDALS